MTYRDEFEKAMSDLGIAIEYQGDGMYRGADERLYQAFLAGRGQMQGRESHLMQIWQAYPETMPVGDGWCVTSDGGDIKLERWSEGKWAEGDRGIIEFAQVTVDA